MALNTMLMFRNADNDAATFPAERLTSMIHDGDTALKLRFLGSANDTTVEEDNVDLVTLTITTGKEMEVMKYLAKVLAFSCPICLIPIEKINLSVLQRQR